MKYISLIDKLGLDIDTLSTLDATAIIKLKKQLKAKAMLGDANNLGELGMLIDELEKEHNRANHVFVEQHPWLKKLVSGNFEAIQHNEIWIKEALLPELEDLRTFLHPFLETVIKPCLSVFLSEGKYLHLLNLLSLNFLYSEAINQTIIKFFKARLDYATVYIREQRLIDKTSPIAFITNKDFVHCLNQYPNRFNAEVQDLNSEAIQVYNSRRKQVKDPLFIFAAKVMVALSVLDTSNEMLKDLLVSNAKTAREYTLPSHSKQKSSSGMSIWGVVFVVFLIIRSLFFVMDNSSSNNKPNFSNINYITQLQKNNLKKLNQLTTYYPVIAHEKSTVPLTYNLYENPYAPKFHEFHVPETKVDISRFDTYVTNKTNKDLILFLLYKNYDKAVYIPKNEKAALQIGKNDTIAFYSGNDFVSFNKLYKFFKSNYYMSQLYIIDSISFEKPHSITVYPENTEAVLRDSKMMVKKEDVITMENVFYKSKTINTVLTNALRNN